MDSRLIAKGAVYQVSAVVLNNGRCPAEEFLGALEVSDEKSHKSMVALLKRHADHGQIRNKKKSRSIKTKDDLFEFKTRQGDRLLYFYQPGGRTILTHGFHKGAPASREYEKAHRLRKQYLLEIEDGRG